MKQLLKKSVFALLLTAGLFLFANADANAASKITNVKQIRSNSSSVAVQWDACLGSGCYTIDISNDNRTYTEHDYTYSSTEDTIIGLTSSSSYYIRISAWDSSSQKVLLGQSDPIVVVTNPTTPNTPTQISATTNAIGLTWNAVPGTSYYEVYNYVSYGNEVLVAKSATNSCVVPRLAAGTSYRFTVRACKQSPSGYVAAGSTSSYKEMKTVPTPVSQLGITDMYTTLDSTYFGWTASSPTADGYQFEMTNYKGKNIHTSYPTSTRLNINVKKGTFYKYRVRPFVLVGNQRVFGGWSAYKYLGVPKTVKIKAVGNRKIRYSFSKIKGAVSYTLSSSTSETGGFKKIKTFKNKKRVVTISKVKGKRIKKKKTYYFKLTAKGKFGKSKKTSSISYYTNYKLY